MTARTKMRQADIDTLERARAKAAQAEADRVAALPKVAPPSDEETALIALRDRIRAADPGRFDLTDDSNDSAILTARLARLNVEIAEHAALRRIEARRIHEAEREAARIAATPPTVSLPVRFGAVDDAFVIRRITPRLASLTIDGEVVHFRNVLTFLSADRAPAFRAALDIVESARVNAYPPDEVQLAVVLDGPERWDLMRVAAAAGVDIVNVGTFLLEHVPDLRVHLRWQESARAAGLDALAARIEERARWVAAQGEYAGPATALTAAGRLSPKPWTVMA